MRVPTHPRTPGRRELRCPFGCRQHHRRQGSSQRSTAYYQTVAGKWKKKRLNARRNGRRDSAAGPPQEDPDPQATLPNGPPPVESGSQGEVADELPGKAELRLEGVVLCESSLAKSPVLPYVRMVVSLIEGIEFRCEEVVRLLRQAMRQHSIANRRKIDYVLSFLHQHPP